MDNKPDAAKWTDRAIVILTAGILVAAGMQTYIFHRQREEMTDSGKQADRIIAADERLAAAMERSNANSKESLDRTIKENKKALVATLAQGQAALNASIAASRSDQRAYVTLGRPDGTAAEIIWPKDGKGNAGLLVYFQNNGRLPAKFNWGADSTIVAMLPSDPAVVKYDMWKGPPTDLPTNHLFQPMYRAKSRKGGVQWSGTIDIAGGSSYEGILWEVPQERMHQLIEFERPFMTSGRFEYCDGFGQRVCKNFHLIYAKDPYNRFFLAMEDACPAYEMQITHPMPNFDYLPPCDTGEWQELQYTLKNLPKP